MSCRIIAFFLVVSKKKRNFAEKFNVSLPQGFLSPTRGTEGVVKTIEDRWGKYSTVGRFPSSSLRFLSPANGGTEGGVKTIEEGRGERWSLP